MVVANKIQAGFAYLAVLFLVAAVSISLAVTSQQIDLQLKREKEQDWLFAGLQYQRAITAYYQQAPDGLSILPKTLDDLTQDKRFVKPKHHLRKAYTDPVNANKSWQLLFNENKQIMGVVSESNQALLAIYPVSRALGLEDAAINTYAEVKFIYKIQKQPQQENADLTTDDVNSANTNINNNNSDNIVEASALSNELEASERE